MPDSTAVCGDVDLGGGVRVQEDERANKKLIVQYRAVARLWPCSADAKTRHSNNCAPVSTWPSPKPHSTIGEVRSLGTILNRTESIRKLVKKLGPVEKLRACYEAGPTGHVLYWQLAELGVKCEVIAPTLVPVKAGDRVKTDRRDAEKLARSYRSGDLTAVWVPDEVPRHCAIWCGRATRKRALLGSNHAEE